MILEIVLTIGLIIIGFLWWVVLPLWFLSYVWNGICNDIGRSVATPNKQEDLHSSLEAKRILKMIKERQSE
jgi:hypothetical protein